MPPAPRRHLATSPFAPPAEVDHPVYEAGQRVLHDSFGLGRVVSVEANSVAVSVDFTSEVRRVVLPTAKMSVL